MKNYYKILEVSENASFEIIEKAYRVLAKKYHPDMQTADTIYWAENKFKEITEAYNVLSDKESRRIYDMQFNSNFSIEEKYDDLYFKQNKLKEEINSLKINQASNSYKNDQNVNSTPEKSSYIKRYTSIIKELIVNERQKAPEERLKDLKALILTLIIVSIMLFVFWKVPFLNKILFP